MMKDPDPVPFPEFAKLIAQLRATSAPKARRKHPSLALVDARRLHRRRAEAHRAHGLRGDRRRRSALQRGQHRRPATTCTTAPRRTSRASCPPSCRGPARALADAQKRAAGLGDPGAQAWAMRDAFDALIEVV